MPVNNKSFEFGRDQLGPIFAHYLARLDQTIRYFEDERGGKVLFVARAGVRIRRLYERYCSALGREAARTGDYFWTSRFMTLKGAWPHQSAIAIKMLSEEFRAGRVADVVAALLRHSEQEWRFDPSRPEVQAPASAFGDFIWGPAVAADLCRWHLTEQSGYFRQYLDELVGEHKSVLLVDSGWQGTAQTLLSDLRPELDWWGAYFGRIGAEQGDRRYWHKMLGLIFEADEPNALDPATAIVGHRHVVEHTLEPDGPSIERLAPDGDRIFAPQASAVLQAEPTAKRDPIYLGVEAYVAGLTSKATPASVLTRAQAVWPGVARTLLFPSRAEAATIAGGTRSADYGRSLDVPMVLPPEPRHHDDSAELRIEQSLWPAAQVALEYPPTLSRARQAQMWGFKPENAWRGPLADELEQPRVFAPAAVARPKVAVITRTLDRVPFLMRAIESVRRQTLQDYVHVIVSDGGEIKPVEEAVKASDADLRRTVVIDNVRNRGMEAASNIAIAAADSEYIVIHDDDDTWEPEFLEKTVEFLESPKGAKYAGVVTNTWYVSEEVRPDEIKVFSRTPYREDLLNVSLMEMAIGNTFAPIAFLFRRSIYKKVGGFDPTLPVLGDWDFNLKILAEADIGVLPLRLANYHHRDRGGPGLFANSVIGGVSKHAEYDPVVRNRLIRWASQSGSATGMAVLVNLGATLQQMRGGLTRIEQKSGGGGWTGSVAKGGQPPPALLRALDDRWLALTLLAGRLATGAGAVAVAPPAQAPPPDRGEEHAAELKSMSDELAETKAKLHLFQRLADDRWVGLASGSAPTRSPGARKLTRGLLRRLKGS